MNSVMNLWPIKNFFGYILKRSIGKFLKSNIDLSKYDFSSKKIAFENLDLNVHVFTHSSTSL